MELWDLGYGHIGIMESWIWLIGFYEILSLGFIGY